MIKAASARFWGDGLPRTGEAATAFCAWPDLEQRYRIERGRDCPLEPVA